MGERAFLNRLEGGCQVPIAAHGKIEKNTFMLSGLVSTIDGRTLIKETLSGSKDSSEAIGTKLADRLIDMGAKTIMENLKADLNQNNER
jgi:hydroxymethylbilane synthase